MEKKTVTQFIKDESGAIMITFAVMVNVLILAIALSMDLGRAYMASSAIAGAADAAAVASSVNGGDEKKAKEYFLANLPVGTLGIRYNYDTDVIHTVDSDKQTVTVNTRDFEVPAFLSAGTNANAAVSLGGGVIVGLGDSAYLPADYFFIIDSSGSMGSSDPLGGTRSGSVGIAVNNFLDIVFANQDVGANGIANYRVSLTNYRSFMSETESYELESDKQTILNQLQPMLSPGGTTCGGCGLEASKGKLILDSLDPNTSSRLRVFIFMTDGKLNQPVYYSEDFPSDYTGMTSSQGRDPNPPHAYAANECLQIKTYPNQNVTFWSIRFGPSASSGINFDTMDYCATKPDQNVLAQTGNDLDQIFSQIGRSTSRVRILK